MTWFFRHENDCVETLGHLVFQETILSQFDLGLFPDGNSNARIM